MNYKNKISFIILILNNLLICRVVAQPVVNSAETLSALVDKAFANIPNKELTPWNGKLEYHDTDWKNIFLLARSNSDLRSRLFKLDEAAQKIIKSNPSMYIRALKYSDIPEDKVDSIALKSGKNRDIRALALFDCTQTRFLLEHVVPLALAARYTGNPDYLNKTIEILREVVQYKPFQRPGWSLGEDDRTLPPGGDGPNMATAWGIFAVVDILYILEDLIPKDLREQLKTNLREEIYGVTKAWADKLPWYVQSRAVMSNQWTDPTTALIKACLYLGESEFLSAYNLGVENIAASLNASENDGAFLEGVTYAQMSAGEMISIVNNIRLTGDRRLDKYPFVSKFWEWLLQMQMPGGFLVNCGDSNMGKLPSYSIKQPLSSMIQAAFASGNPSALQALKFAFPDSDDTLNGIKYVAATLNTITPINWTLPLFAFFPSQQLLVWRSKYQPPSEQQTALGLWIKGGSLGERSHGHRDQGQVSIYSGTRVILMDCGTPQNYGDADLETRYTPAAGHNIMQVGEIKPRVQAVDAPLEIIKINENGGSVQLDLKNVYNSVISCIRKIKWDRLGQMIISDSVEWKLPIIGDTEIYRFHTGSQVPVLISGTKNEWKVVWSDATMWLKADQPIRIDQEIWPDHIQKPFKHQVIIIRAGSLMQKVNLQTTLIVNAQSISNSN